MQTDPTPRACTLDAMGTMLRLLPPWEQIDPRLVAGIPAEIVESAFKREMRFYAAHATEASDAEALASLRRRCAEILSEDLGRPVGVESMMSAIHFEPFPETEAVLADLRGRGLRLACVSNWDVELPAVLERLGLGEHFDAVIASAAVGVAKPDPAIFELALERLGCSPAETLHVGDSDVDVEGAKAAGLDVLRIDRDGSGTSGAAPTITSLSEISEHLPG